MVRTRALVHVASLALGHFARAAQLQVSGEALARLAPHEVSLLVCEFASRRLLCLADVRAFWAQGLALVQAQGALKRSPKALLAFLGEQELSLFPRSNEL